MVGGKHVAKFEGVEVLVTFQAFALPQGLPQKDHFGDVAREIMQGKLDTVFLRESLVADAEGLVFAGKLVKIILCLLMQKADHNRLQQIAGGFQTVEQQQITARLQTLQVVIKSAEHSLFSKWNVNLTKFFIVGIRKDMVQGVHQQHDFKFSQSG